MVELAGPWLDDPVDLAAQLGVRSKWLISQLLRNWKQKLKHRKAPSSLTLVMVLLPNCTETYPAVRLVPDFKNCSGPLLNSVDHQGVPLEGSSGKGFYKLMVETVNQTKLDGRSDTPRRNHLDLDPGVEPAWRSLYKPPLVKTPGDLQWRILRGIVGMNDFYVIIAAVQEKFPFCTRDDAPLHSD